MGSDNPRPGVPPFDPRLHPNPAPGASLVEQLGGVADELRQLFTDAGLRPYRVFSVQEQWSGGTVGVGIPVVVRETEFLPTPLLDLTPLRRKMNQGGFSEDGAVTLRQISPRLTEDQVGLLCCGDRSIPGRETYIEVRHDARDGTEVPRRRFTIQGVPFRKAGKFEWQVRLLKANPDRSPQGALTGERQEFPDRLRNPLMDEE